MKKVFFKKQQNEVKKASGIKKAWGKVVCKTYMAGAIATLSLTPTVAGAEAPSKYVNKISDSLFGEILKVAPKVVLVVMGWALLMYFISGDDHKKSKYKTTAGIAIIGYLILLVLKPLMAWMGGLV
ncbi:hypothetical protein SC499_22480 [Peribacillus simplex]|uniref:hypothetical protein n=1 Tax=Peribacillus simplex TaxID=1478 RepID=UPI00298EBD1A|nr:hypothetical protein [Peribacillus simplex]MDW7617371.1 hypothetical protein [Peribacillus simplex]